MGLGAPKSWRQHARHGSCIGWRGTKKALSDLLRRNPERTLSRLLSPRRLDPSTSYVACVVPTFDVGRKAGLGEAISEDDERTLRPAWDSGVGDGRTERVRLPVYYSWEFSTRTEGDFEALARRLERRKLPATLSLRNMSLRTPGWGMSELPSGTEGTSLGLEGALRTPDSESTAWPDGTRATFQTELRQILNAPNQHASSEGETYLVGRRSMGNGTRSNGRFPMATIFRIGSVN
jgi:hypothetical protein